MTIRQANPDGDGPLMLRIAADDTEAFSQLYQKYAPMIRRHCANDDKEGLDDLVQEVFVRAWVCRRRYRGEASAGTYLVGIAKNVIRSARCQSQRVQGINRDNAYVPVGFRKPRAGGPDAKVRDQELASRIEQATRELTYAQRQALELVHIYQFSINEAAELVNCTVSQLSSRLYRAKKHIKYLLRNLLKEGTS